MNDPLSMVAYAVRRIGSVAGSASNPILPKVVLQFVSAEERFKFERAAMMSMRSSASMANAVSGKHDGVEVELRHNDAERLFKAYMTVRARYAILDVEMPEGKTFDIVRVDRGNNAGALIESRIQNRQLTEEILNRMIFEEITR